MHAIAIQETPTPLYIFGIPVRKYDLIIKFSTFYNIENNINNNNIKHGEDTFLHDDVHGATISRPT